MLATAKFADGATMAIQMTMLFALQVCTKHAEVKESGGIFTVTDLGSVNGTWVNDRRIKPKQPIKILPGDLIHCGERSESHGFRVS